MIIRTNVVNLTRLFLYMKVFRIPHTWKTHSKPRCCYYNNIFPWFNVPIKINKESTFVLAKCHLITKFYLFKNLNSRSTCSRQFVQVSTKYIKYSHFSFRLQVPQIMLWNSKIDSKKLANYITFLSFKIGRVKMKLINSYLLAFLPKEVLPTTSR